MNGKRRGRLCPAPAGESARANKRVMITGWLLYDLMHETNAANTNPNGNRIWRSTCEEIHPVSGIKVLH